MPLVENWLSVDEAVRLIFQNRGKLSGDLGEWLETLEELAGQIERGTVYAAGQLQHPKAVAAFVVAPPPGKAIDIGRGGYLYVYDREKFRTSEPILVIQNLQIHRDSLVAAIEGRHLPAVPGFAWSPPNLDEYLQDSSSWTDPNAGILKAACELKIVRAWTPVEEQGPPGQTQGGEGSAKPRRTPKLTSAKESLGEIYGEVSPSQIQLNVITTDVNKSLKKKGLTPVSSDTVRRALIKKGWWTERH